VTSFFTDVHSETLLALLPTFMAEVLHLPKGAIGFIEGLAQSAASLLQIFSGWLSDRLKARKPFAVLGYTLSTIVKALLSLATCGAHVLAVRLADRVGKGLRTAPRDALLAESVAPEFRGRAFGFHRAADTLGAVVGSAGAFGLLLLLEDYRKVFIWAALGGAAAVAVLAFVVHDVRPKEEPEEAKPQAPQQPEQRRRPSRTFRVFIVAHAIFSLGNFSYVFFLLRARNLALPEALVPILYLVYNVVYALTAMPAGRLGDQVGHRRVLVGSYVLYCLTCVGLAAARGLWVVWPLMCVYALHSATVNPAMRALAANLAGGRRGTALGLLHTVSGAAALPASWVAGELWQRFQPHWPFVVGAVLAVLAALVLASVQEPDAAGRKPAEGAQT